MLVYKKKLMAERHFLLVKLAEPGLAYIHHLSPY